MISSAKLQVHFVVFEEITSAYLHHIALKIMLLLINNLYEKSIKESEDGQNVDRAHALFVIYTHVTILHLCYMKNVLFFSQSNASNSFMYIIGTLTAVCLASCVWDSP